ncbi:MAG: pirin family protein [Nitrospinota bacterium]
MKTNRSVEQVRQVKKKLTSQHVMEGAGVRLRRAFGRSELSLFDPFLLLDDFGSDTPQDYLAGFPWHPHRGIKTVTYMLAGEVEHSDSLGNKGVIRSGGVQWMTAGSGIIHQEMPRKSEAPTRGFQLWVNLPAKSKMIAPQYQDVMKEEVPEIDSGDGIKTRVIAGKELAVKGPVQDNLTEAGYFDIFLPPKKTLRKPIQPGHACFAYVINGKGCFGSEKSEYEEGDLLLFHDGQEVMVRSFESEVRFLLVSGRPLGEPVAWGGPIVMNTTRELQVAMEEYRNGTFIKENKSTSL